MLPRARPKRARRGLTPAISSRPASVLNRTPSVSLPAGAERRSSTRPPTRRTAAKRARPVTGAQPDAVEPVGGEALRSGRRRLLCVPATAEPCARLTSVTGGGTTECGGPQFNPAPEAPFAGQLYDATSGGNVVWNLGDGCTYFGGGNSTIYPSKQQVVGTTLTLDAHRARAHARAVASRDVGPGSCVRPGREDLNACTSAARRDDRVWRTAGLRTHALLRRAAAPFVNSPASVCITGPLASGHRSVTPVTGAYALRHGERPDARLPPVVRRNPNPCRAASASATVTAPRAARASSANAGRRASTVRRTIRRSSCRSARPPPPARPTRRSSQRGRALLSGADASRRSASGREADRDDRHAPATPRGPHQATLLDLPASVDREPGADQVATSGRRRRARPGRSSSRSDRSSRHRFARAIAPSQCALGFAARVCVSRSTARGRTSVSSRAPTSCRADSDVAAHRCRRARRDALERARRTRCARRRRGADAVLGDEDRHACVTCHARRIVAFERLGPELVSPSA